MSTKTKYLSIFALIIFAELFSFLGYLFPIVNAICFFVIFFVAIILSLKDLKYGLYLILAELFIGSFGYLFYFEFEGLKISLRQALWLAVISIWLGKTVLDWIKTKKLIFDYFKSEYGKYLSILIIFISLAVVNGLILGNGPANIFFDFNQWLFWLLIFPVRQVFSQPGDLKTLKIIFLSATAWLSVKTLLLAYIFSHDFGPGVLNLYLWVRQSGVGEITRVQGGFFRVFIQSHIFVLIGLFIIIFEYLFSQAKLKKFFVSYFWLLTLFFSAIVISFSRSFWLGLAAGFIFVWPVMIFKLKIKFINFAKLNLQFLAAAIAGLVLTAAIIFFPAPAPFGGFNPADLLSRRVTDLSGEAGASSRWQLLRPVWDKINLAPVLGRGFGSTVTYKTNDPRVIAQSPDGLYTTYAFEWGWLDIWLKLGLFGLLAYFALFVKLIFDGLKINSGLSLGLAAGVIVLAAVNLTSPYVNHPLGIGYILIVMAIMNRPLPKLNDSCIL